MRLESPLKKLVPKKSKLTHNNNGLSPAEQPPRKPGPSRRSTAAKKSAAPRKKKQAAPKTAPGKSTPDSLIEPTDAEIRMRAYFIGERRHRLGLPGDSNSDWLEAKRQLLSEVKPR